MLNKLLTSRFESDDCIKRVPILYQNTATGQLTTIDLAATIDALEAEESLLMRGRPYFYEEWDEEML